MSIPLTNGHGPQIGDPCQRENCCGVLGVGTTIVDRENSVRIRYLRCRECKSSPMANKQVVPLHYAPPRI
jgi:hypothetical protein